MQKNDQHKPTSKTLGTALRALKAPNQTRRSLVMAAALASVGVPSAWAAEPIVIGRSLALSGPLKTYGEAKRDGGDAYIEQINKAGGVGGRALKVVTLDDEYRPDKIIINLKSLAATEQPIAFLGLFGVPTVAAALPLLLDLKIPAVGLTSGAAAVRTPFNAYAFPVRASYADEAQKLVSQVRTIGISRISVIYTDNPFGESVKDTLSGALQKAGIKALVYKLDPAGKDAASVAGKVMAQKPQGVFLAMLSQPAVPVLGELKKSESGTFLYAFSPVDTTVVIKELGKRSSGLNISQIVPIPSSRNYALTTEYALAMKALGRGTPSFYGLEAYLEAKVLVEGLRRAGPAPSSAGLLKALETMQDWNAGGLYINYSPGQHNGANFVEVDGIDDNGVLRR